MYYHILISLPTIILLLSFLLSLLSYYGHYYTIMCVSTLISQYWPLLLTSRVIMIIITMIMIIVIIITIIIIIIINNNHYQAINNPLLTTAYPSLSYSSPLASSMTSRFKHRQSDVARGRGAVRRPGGDRRQAQANGKTSSPFLTFKGGTPKPIGKP